MAIQERALKGSRHIAIILISGLLLATWFAFVLPYIASEIISQQNIAELAKAPDAKAATIFSRVQNASGEGNPASATFGATPASGNLLVVIAMHRVATAGSAFTITGSGWTKRVAHDALLGDPNARRALAIWTKVAGVSEPTNIQIDNGTADTIKVLIQEFQAGATVTWTFEAQSSGDTGTGSTSPLSTGSTTSVGAGDLLLVGSAIWRNGSGAPGSIGWTNSIGTTVQDLGGTNGRSINTGFVQDSASGTKSTSVSWTGAGHEASAAILVFSAVTPNNAPTLTGTGCSGGAAYSDSPDPQTAGSNITFCGDFNDTDGDAVRVLACKSNAITPSGTGGSCPGGAWASTTTAATTPDPRNETYTAQSADVGTSPNNYYMFVCDVNSGCSGTTGNSGTFTVNDAPPTVTTNAATHITPSSGRLHGTVTASGGASIAQVQQNSTNSGGANLTTATATLGVGATSGNLLVTALAVDKDAGTVTVPSGFTMINTGKSTPGTTGALAYKVSTGGETSIQWSYTNSEQNSVWAAEYSGINSASPLDKSAENDSAGVSVTSISTGTTVATTQADELSISMVAVDSWDGFEFGRSWTNSFSELVYEYDTGAASPGLGVASKTLTVTGAVETTLSTTSAGDQVYATVATFKASGGSTDAYFRYWTSNPANCSASGYTQTAIQTFSNPSGQAFSDDIALADGQSYWYCAFGDNGTLISGVEQTFTAGAAGWYSTGGTWLYRKKITVNNAKVANSNLLQFPVLIDIKTDTDLQARLGQTDGGDVVFTGPDGTTKLDHEIELVDKTAGDLVAWVEVTKTTGDAFELLNSVDTVLYMYYGDATVANQWSITGTWDSGYYGVWHLGEDQAGVGNLNVYQDSTSNNNDGNDEVSSTGKTGKIGNGQEFDGADDYIKVADSVSLSPTGTSLTMSAWVYMPSLRSQAQIFFGKTNADGTHVLPYFAYSNHIFGTSNKPRSYVAKTGTNKASAESSNALSATTWYYVVGRYDGANLKLYINDVEKASTANTVALQDKPGPFNIAANGLPGEFFLGQIDEVRVSSLRTTNWMTTEYNNQNSVSTFYTLGAEEVLGPSATTDTATLVTSTTADLNGTINPNGTSTNGWFRYSVTNPGTCNDTFGTLTSTQAMGSGTSGVTIVQSIATLTKNTPYYFCAIAEDINLTKAFGSILQFTTTADAPSEVVADPATAVLAYSATLWGKANPNSAATTGWFRYDTVNPNTCNDTFGTRAPSTGGVNVGSGSVQTTYSQSVSGLVQNSTYYFCSIANNSGGTTHSGNDIEFFTTPISLNDAPIIGSVAVSPEPSRSGPSRVLSWDDRYSSIGGLSTGKSLSIDSAACNANDNVYIVQYRDARVDTTDGSPDISLTLSSVPTSGNLLVGIVSSSDAGVDITGPAGWTQAIEQAYTGPSRVRTEVWYKVAGVSEATALTFNQAVGSGNPRALAVYEFAGMATSNVLDKTQGESSGSSATTMAPGPTALTSQANELAIVSIVSDNEQRNWSRDFTNGFTYSSDVVTGGGGNQAATIIALKLLSSIDTVSTSTSWGDVSEQASTIATFKVDMASCGVTTAIPEEIRIAYYDETAGSAVTAKYVGDASGSCLNNDWDCDTIAASGGVHGEGVQLKYDSAGNAWVAYQFVPTAANATLMVAQYVGSGGTCATNYGGSTGWNCTIVDDPVAGSVGITANANGGGIGIAFDSSDNPWVSYYDVTNTDLKVAHFVGSGAGAGCSSGSNNWVCESVDGSGEDTGESWNSIARDGSGVMWVTYRNNADTSLKVAKYVGGGGGGSSTITQVQKASDLVENDIPVVNLGSDPVVGNLLVATFGGRNTLPTAPSGWSTAASVDVQVEKSAVYYKIAEAADTTTVTYGSSGGRGNAVVMEYSSSSGWDVSPVDKFASNYCDTVSQCDTTSISTTSADELLIASFGMDSGDFSGRTYSNSFTEEGYACTAACGSGNGAGAAASRVVSATGSYSTLFNFNGSGSDVQAALVSFKAANSGGTGCDDPDWTCEIIDNGGDDGDLAAMDIHPGTGFPWIAYAQQSSAELQVARYTGTGSENSCVGGSSNWLCSTVDTVNGLAGQTTIAFESDGTAWISVFDKVAAPDEMFVAQYVGSGGSCSNVAWDCEHIFNTTVIGAFPSIVIDSNDAPWFSYGSHVANEVKVAKYVGSGGTGCQTIPITTKWTCASVNGANYVSGNLYTSMAIRTGVTTSSANIAEVQVPLSVKVNDPGNTTISASYATTPTAGNMLIAVHTHESGTMATPPSGWEAVSVEAFGADSSGLGVYYKVADSSDKGPWTWTIPDAQHQVLTLMEYSGIATTNPVDRALIESWPTYASTATAIMDPKSPATGVWDTRYDDELIIAVVAVADEPGAWNNVWNNGFISRASVSTTGGAASVRVGQEIAERIVIAKGTYETTETWTNTSRSATAMVTFRAASEAYSDNGINGFSANSTDIINKTDLELARPAGTQSGDVMLAFVDGSKNYPATGTWSTPSGWTKVLENNHTVGSESLDAALFYKVAGGSEAAFYTFTYSELARLHGGMLSYSGIDTTGSPIDVSTSLQDNTFDSSFVAPSVTTTQANTLLAVGWFSDTYSGNPTAMPAGMSSRISSRSNSGALTVADEVLTSAGATGTRTMTSAVSDYGLGITVALKCSTDCTEIITSSTACDPATWYDCDWQYRQKITVDHSRVGEGKLTLPGLTTDYVSTPDKASLDITGDIDIRFKYAPADWTSAVNETIVAKWNPNSDNATLESWNVWYSPAGDELKLYWNESDGTQRLSVLSWASEGFPPNDGSSVTARIVLDVDKSGQWETSLYRSNNDGLTWGSALDTQTGSTGISSIYASTHDLYIGRADEGGSERMFTGGVYWVEIYDGISGTLIANPNFTNKDQGDWSLGSGTDTAGNTWTINGAGWTYNAPSNMTNFPLYLDIAQLGSQFFAGVNSDGGDIRVTTSDGITEIGREVVSTDTVGETGEIYFLAPTISASSDTDFYIYYGNSSVTDYVASAVYGRNLVWTTAGYVGVWHMEEVCSDGSVGCIVDSTGQNNATANNFQDGGGGTTDATGKLGGGDLFESGASADDRHSFPANASRSVGTTYTVSAWVKPEGVSSWNSPHTIFSSRHQPDLSFRGDDNSGPLGLRGLAYDATSGSWASWDCDDSLTIFEEGKWDYVGMTVNGTDVRVYENSSRRPNQNSVDDCTLASAPLGSDTGTGYIGSFRTSSLYSWEGTLDEVRFSDNTLSEEWLHTEYNSQVGTTTFATYGGTKSSTSTAFTSGTLTSLTLDTRSPNGVGINSFMWRGTKPAGTSARFWIASSECPNGETNPPDCTTPADPGVYETFTGADSDPWDVSSWTSSILSGGVVDISGNWGRLSNTATAGSTARVLSIMDPANDSEVLVRFNSNNPTWTDSNDRSFRMFLRASGDWDSTNTANPTTGYAVEFDTPANRFRLYRVIGGGLTQIGSDYIPTTTNDLTHQVLRFRVEGTQIKLRTWGYFAKEPTVWQIEAVDGLVTGNGVLQMSLTASGAANVGEFSLDDLYVSNPAIGSAGSGSTGGQWDYRGVSCSIDGTPYTPASGTVVDVGCDSENYNNRYIRYKIQLCSTFDCSTAGQFTPDVQDIIVNWSR